MSVARRNFHVPPDGQRCKAIAKAAAGNPDGRCMRRRLPGFDLCTQHLKVGDLWPSRPCLHKMLDSQGGDK